MVQRLCIFGLAVLFLTACSETLEEVESSWPDGSPREVTVYNVSGETKTPTAYKEYHENGHIYMEGPYDAELKRHGIWTAYHNDGTNQSQTEYTHGSKEGFTKVWYPNGALRYEGQYKGNVKSGDWTYYKEDGSVATTMSY